MMSFSPLLPAPILIVLLCIVVVFAVFFGLFRRARGAFLRAAILGLLCFFLARPVSISEEREPIKDIALLVVDRSLSQQLDQRAARTEQIVQTLKEQLEHHKALEVQILQSPLYSNKSDLFTLMAEADVPRDRIAGTILITDGQVQDVPTQIDLPGPLHVILTGDGQEKDRTIKILKSPSYGVTGSEISISLQIEQTGFPSSSTALTILSLSDQREWTKQISIGEPIHLTLPVTRRGENVFEFKIPTLPEELTALNNQAFVRVEGIRDRLKVLLVSGAPHMGGRVWRNLLKSDPSVDLVHFTILRSNASRDPTPEKELSLIPFPVKELFEDRLQDFDLIIFDHYKRRGILSPRYFNNIVTHVKKGGAVLLTGGKEFSGVQSLFHTGLAEILPASPTGIFMRTPFKPSLTEQGRHHPVTAPFSKQEWGRWFQQVAVNQDRGTVLLKGNEDHPLLLLDEVEHGRVAQFTSDHLWLWSKGLEGGGPHLGLLRRLVHWLMKEPDLEADRLTATLTANGILQIKQHAMPDQNSPSVTVTTPSGAVHQLPLNTNKNGFLTARLDTKEQGIYRISSGQKTIFAGSSTATEMINLQTTRTVLEPLVKKTGGQIIPFSDLKSLSIRHLKKGRQPAGQHWIGFTKNNRHTVTALTSIPLIPPFLALSLILALLALAWWREN